MMSNSVENASFDVEAQESLLVTPTEAGLAESETTSIIARQNLQRTILVIRSIELFKSGANYAADISSSPSSTASGYAVVGSGPEERIQDSGNAAAIEIPADAAQEISSAYSVAENEHNNKLQCVQRKSISDIVKEKNFHQFHTFGGVRGIAEALNTDLENGISSPQANICQCKPGQISQFLTTFFHSFFVACNNYTVFLLSVAAALSLFFGIKEEGLARGWFNGAVVLFAIFALVICQTIQNFLQERRSLKKLENSRQLKVQVLRGGCSLFVPEIALQVGDIAVLQKGDQIPADGIFIAGQALEVDEGSIKSTTINEDNPFIFYGSRVINGNARMIVTSTGMDTVWGEMVNQAIGSSDKKCKLEACLHKLNTCTHFTGLLISILIIIVQFLRYKAGKLDDENGAYKPDPKGEPARVKTIIEIIKGIITGSKGTARVLTTLLSVSLLGVMEGMPFVISVAIFIWNSKTLAHKASQRDYLAFIKMASVTTICSDKFGGLTEHAMEIDKFLVGGEFVSESSVVASNVLEGLCDGIGTLFLIPPSGSESKVVPLISWAEEKLGLKEGSVREQCKMISCNGCDPFQECCQVLMEKSGNEGQKKYRHYKGPPQHILSLCSHYYDIKGEMQELDDKKKRMFVPAFGRMLAEEAEVIAYARECVNESDVALGETKCLIFMGMIGLKDTKKNDTKTAVSTLMKAEIRTILASGDDVAVLQTIGQNCGLLTPGSDDLVLTAEKFRDWTHEEKMDKVEKICIMGNCLPSDKILLIKYLREKGRVVALLAERTIDAPALKQADIGLTFGTWSSEVARECCDISIWDGNCFSFLVSLIENGRCFQDNIRKLIQLQLIITISSSLINFTAIVFLGDAPITAVQLFWLNLVVALVGGLALLTEPSTKTLMTMPPVESSAKLITKAMWRNIAIQASYQTIIFVTLQHKGQSILGTSGDRVKSIIYNGFFLCQVFNKFIAREPEKKNIFGGLFHNNLWFWVALVLFLVCQGVFAIAEIVLGSSPWLNWKLWGVCLLVGLVSWLLDWAGKSVSNYIDRWAADPGRN